MTGGSTPIAQEFEVRWVHRSGLKKARHVHDRVRNAVESRLDFESTEKPSKRS